jgi:glucosyl-3-phosphoglycerate synthase
VIPVSALAWSRAASHDHTAFRPRSRAERDASISVCVPAREEARTIGAIVETLVGLRRREIVDQVVVVDAASPDGTADRAERAGADVLQQGDLRPELGPVRGKGDAMWRALSVLSGDLVCFLDADTAGFGPQFVTGLVGPLLADAEVHFVKATYRRPFRAEGVELDHGGGRVNDLTARPLLNRFFPELAAVRQPLAGEMAARRELLLDLPFCTGYGVEIGLLIDAYRRVGLRGIAEVDLGVRRNRHQALGELGGMAATVTGALMRRLDHGHGAPGAGQDAFLTAGVSGWTVEETAAEERPPARLFEHSAAGMR